MISATLRRATARDVGVLTLFARATFLQTFVDQFAMNYPAEDLEAFLGEAYSEETFARTLCNSEVGAWIAEAEGRIVGYATAGPCGLPHLDVGPDDGELYRLYIDRDAQGSLLGSRLLETALEWLERSGPRTLWLGVWSGNHKAQRLYARYGFSKAGEYEFPVGRIRDREFIMRRKPS